MKWEIIHRTSYAYAAPVRDSFNEARLQPFSDEWQTVDHFLLKVLPAARLRHHLDFYSNVVHHFEITEPHTALSVESNLRDHQTAPIARRDGNSVATGADRRSGTRNAGVRFFAGEPVCRDLAGILAAGH